MKKDKTKHKEKTKEKEIEIKDETNLEDVDQLDKVDQVGEDETEEENVNEETSVEKLEETIQELKDTVLRKAAEFENYKRRTENDQLNLFKYAAESFILKILPVYDDLQRSIEHLDESNLDSIKDGLKLVFDKFTKTFDEQGIKKIDAQGESFDVEFHEALLQQPSTDVEPNTVLQEVEAGYMYKDKVIKHSKVVVSQEVEEPAEETKDKEE